MHRFVVLGCNHTSASAAEIGRCRIPEAQVESVLPVLAERIGAAELAYLATCHRTEWYAAYDSTLCPGRLALHLAEALPAVTGGAAVLPPVGRCLLLHGRPAAEHLFRVAASLESLMLGEAQILGQVKEALRRSAALGLAGPLLSTVFSQAFRAAKRVRTETGLGRHPVSLVSLIAAPMRARLAEDSGPVVVLGAGTMAAHALALVRNLDPGREVLVCNRSRERGAPLAQRFGATYLPLAEFVQAPRRCAVLVAAVASETPVITPAVAQRIAPALVIDLGMPANVDASCQAVPGIQVVAQAGLAEQAAANRAARARELLAAEAIVAEQLEELAYELLERELSPVARQLLARFRATTRQELERLAQDCGGSGGVDLEATADRLSRKLVRVPLRGLREVAWLHSPAVLATFLDAVEQ